VNVGYERKQVRDNIHSLDLVNMFWEYYQATSPGEVYNAGAADSATAQTTDRIRIPAPRLIKEL
jgi:CDP-paratose 2-epimerase